MTLVTEDDAYHLPTRAQEVFDSAGASDTVAATFAMALAGGLKPVDGAFVANVAAGIVLRKSGTYAITREDIINAMRS